MEAADNPRAVVGHNQPPNAAILDAKPLFHELGEWLKDNPVISIDEESRSAKDLHDRTKQAFRIMERERDGRVRPLNEEVKAINDEYRLPVWHKQADELLGRMNVFAKAEERKQYEAEQAARRAAEEAAEAARRAAEAEAEAREAAAAGVCDIDMAEVVEEAHTTSQRAKRAMWTARRAEGQTKVRITGGSGNAISLRDHETLIVTDWRAAIEEMCDDDGNPPQDITDAILKCARGYRKTCKDLPAGVTANFERSL